MTIHLSLNPAWDSGISVVEPQDLSRLLGQEGLERLEEQVTGIDAMIALYGERATVEALRRRGVLVEVPVSDGSVSLQDLFGPRPDRTTGEPICSGSRCGQFMREHGHTDGFCRKWKKEATPRTTRCERKP